MMEQKTIHVHAGNFLLTRPWQLHKFGAPNIGRGRLHWMILDVGVRRPNQNWKWPEWIVLTKADRAELTERWQQLKHPVWNSTPPIAQSFRELARCITAWNQPHAVSRMAGHLNMLLIGVLDALVEQQTQENGQLPSRMQAVETFLRELKDGVIDLGEQWTLDRLASHCNLGVTAFSKYCRELVNIGPMEYLNQCRLERAAQQLRTHPELSVTEIAFANGFNSSQYFATRFRRHYNVSPTRFVSERINAVFKK